MVAARDVREWYAFFGGEESGVSLEQASVIWEAATKAAEARFAATNSDALIRSAVLDCPLELRMKIYEALDEYKVAQQRQ